MKTKHREDNLILDNSISPEENPFYKNRARWKRKNLETQLKRSLTKAHRYNRNCVKIIDEHRKALNDYLEVIGLYFDNNLNTDWFQTQEGN